MSKENPSRQQREMLAVMDQITKMVNDPEVMTQLVASGVTIDISKLLNAFKEAFSQHFTQSDILWLKSIGVGVQ